MNKLFALFILIFSLQSCENKTGKKIKDSHQIKEKAEEWTKEQEEELAGSLSVKFDDDSLVDNFNILFNEDEIAQSVLSVYLSSQKKEVKINLLNNSVLYNNKESAYYTFFTINEKKICIVTIQYADQESIPNISGEKKDLVEKIRLRFNNQNHKIQVIGYDVSYQKETKSITKSFNFITGKYIATSKIDGKTSTVDGWSAELENIYAEDWNFPLVRDKIFWIGEEVE
ncbi:hypothetical protein NJT12_05920 [Flavobacterium sp. AC]|uniref:Uncharacterized protein n=1 Tax=Flavobacterium azizsancarii TaxID=2961580 RepID=A0ABT4W9D8_9FLAO|nr:hypothetical protein [Flavobacterium azizsancarii]MDA6069151.1 hypothetical protein [Flavobacterium azizsancarii]